jgi:multidrug efflux pump subunit AcrA (membrane-fusion protein)
MAIPRSAVIWPGSTPRVFVQTGSDTYVQRRVKLGRAGDTLWEVLDGLQAGELIVAQAAMLLDGQAQLEGAAEAPRAPEMCVATVAP